jgi:hypothetical protein
MAATLGGAAYSEVAEYDVPQVPWYKLIAKSYVGDLHSYFEEVPCEYPAHVIDVDFDLENATLTLNNLDAWAGAQGVPTTFTGSVDLDTRVALCLQRNVYIATLLGSEVETYHGFRIVPITNSAPALINRRIAPRGNIRITR